MHNLHSQKLQTDFIVWTILKVVGKISPRAPVYGYTGRQSKIVMVARLKQIKTLLNVDYIPKAKGRIAEALL